MRTGPYVPAHNSAGSTRVQGPLQSDGSEASRCLVTQCFDIGHAVLSPSEPINEPGTV